MTKIIPEQNKINGAFDSIQDGEKLFFLKLMSFYHYRDGVKNDDGSVGTIQITPKQLLDTIAYVYLNEDMLINQVKKIIQQNDDVVKMNRAIVDMLCLPKIKLVDAHEPK